MQINKPTPDRLEIIHVPWGMWIIGAVVGTMGVVVLTLAARDVGVVAMIMGGIWVVVGVFLSPIGTGLRTTWDFERQTGLATITRQLVQGTKVEQIPFSEIRQVALQRSTSSKGRSTYRVALELHGNREHALTGYYSNSDIAAKKRAVAAIKEFLQLQVPQAAADPKGIFQEAFQSYWSAPPAKKADAAERFRQTLQQNPADLAAWLYLADATGDPLERRSAFERVIALDLNGPYGKRAAAALARMNEAMPNGPAMTGETTRLSAADFGPEPNVALPPIPGQVSLPLGELLLGAVMLRPAAYRAIAHDGSLTTIAAILVLTVGLVSGFFAGLFPAGTLTINGQLIEPGLPYAVGNMLARAISDLAGWFISASLCATIAAQFFRGLTNRGEMLRVFGFTSLFKLLGVFPPLLVPAFVLSAIAVVTAIREAAEFDTGRAIATAVITTMLGGFISGIIGLIISALFLVPFAG
jgi:hypothetical protein